jgi:Holliday junction resolvase RusA-like endonuclease
MGLSSWFHSALDSLLDLLGWPDPRGSGRVGLAQPAMICDFVVFGIPVALQKKGHRHRRLMEWRGEVRAAAAAAWLPRIPLGNEVLVVLTHFYLGASSDVDNIVKPILDEFKGIIYHDDKQISDLVSRHRPLDGQFEVQMATPALAAALGGEREFLHVSIWEPPVGGYLSYP